MTFKVLIDIIIQGGQMDIDPEKVQKAMKQMAAALNPSNDSYLAHLKSRRDSLITGASKLTAIIDFIDNHPDVLEFIELMDKLDKEE